MIWQCPICGFERDGGEFDPHHTIVTVYPNGRTGIDVFVVFGSIQDGTLSPCLHDEISFEIMRTWGVCLMSAEALTVGECDGRVCD
jgi:hypothetical protein